jgi:hypothetical protein
MNCFRLLCLVGWFCVAAAAVDAEPSRAREQADRSAEEPSRAREQADRSAEEPSRAREQTDRSLTVAAQTMRALMSSPASPELSLLPPLQGLFHRGLGCFPGRHLRFWISDFGFWTGLRGKTVSPGGRYGSLAWGYHIPVLQAEGHGPSRPGAGQRRVLAGTG